MTTTLGESALQRMGVTPASAARLLAMAKAPTRTDPLSGTRPRSELTRPVLHTKAHIDRLTAIARDLGYVRD